MPPLIIPRVEITPTCTSPPASRARRLRRHRPRCHRARRAIRPTRSTTCSGSVCRRPAPFGLVTKPREIWAGQLYSRYVQDLLLDVNADRRLKVNDWLSVARRSVASSTSRCATSRRSGRPGQSIAVRASAVLEGDDIGFGLLARRDPDAVRRHLDRYRLPLARSTTSSRERSASERSAHRRDSDQGRADHAGTGHRRPVASAITPRLDPACRLRVDELEPSRDPASSIGHRRLRVVTVPAARLRRRLVLLGRRRVHAERPAWTCAPASPTRCRRSTRAIRSTRLPDTDRIWLSLGATYQWSDKLSFDVAYTPHLRGGRHAISASRPGNPIFPTRAAVPRPTSTRAVDIVSAAVSYRWDNPTGRHPGRSDRAQVLIVSTIRKMEKAGIAPAFFFWRRPNGSAFRTSSARKFPAHRRAA